MEAISKYYANCMGGGENAPHLYRGRALVGSGENPPEANGLKSLISC